MTTPRIVSDLESEGPWLFSEPRVRVERLELSDHHCAQILRDDLLHPYVSGNKLRKLDGYLPRLQARGVRHVISCGGIQSAHAAALACICAERGLVSHLLLRGEQAAPLTGHTLWTHLFSGCVRYVDRDQYADREAMLTAYQTELLEAGHDPQSVAIIPEGAHHVWALFGWIRVISALASRLEDANRTPWTLVIDAGTGTSTAGLALGVWALGLPWRIIGVALGRGWSKTLVPSVRALCVLAASELGLNEPTDAFWDAQFDFVERIAPRRFGKVLVGEVARCARIGRRTGIAFDPIYSLAAYNYVEEQLASRTGGQPTLLVHTGGATNLFGLAQRLGLRSLT